MIKQLHHWSEWHSPISSLPFGLHLYSTSPALCVNNVAVMQAVGQFSRQSCFVKCETKRWGRSREAAPKGDSLLLISCNPKDFGHVDVSWLLLEGPFRSSRRRIISLVTLLPATPPVLRCKASLQIRQCYRWSLFCAPSRQPRHFRRDVRRDLTSSLEIWVPPPPSNIMTCRSSLRLIPTGGCSYSFGSASDCVVSLPPGRRANHDKSLKPFDDTRYPPDRTWLIQMAFPWEQFKATEDQQDKKSFLLCRQSKRNHEDEDKVGFRESVLRIDKEGGLMN